MKRRISALFLVLLTALTLSSCGFFSFVVERLTKITISDDNASYLIGQIYANDNSLSITGTYSDDSTKELKLSDVNVSLTCEGTSYSVSKAFSTAGDYKLSVTKDNVKSNEITFTVFQEAQYVTSMTASGVHEMYVGNITNLSLQVEPSYFTVEINATSSNDEVAIVSKTNKTSFKVSALAEGEVDITFRALRAEEDYVTVSHHIAVAQKQTVDMEYTYHDLKQNNYYNTPGFPLSGTQQILVVPVWLTDSTSYVKTASKNNVLSDISKVYFGSKSETGWHSVSTFYNEESSGALDLQGKVSGWWECGLSSTTVSGYKNSNTLAIAAADWYFQSNPTDSRKNYDNNNDGYIDSIMLIYAAPDYQILTSLGDNMWAYCFWAQDPNQKSTTNPGVNTYFWASYDFMYGSNTALNRTGNSYCNGDTSHCTLDAHTYIHEMGHVLGLDDYYDYSKTNKLNPAGGFSMQDSNVGGHDAFSVTALGWSNVYIPNKSCELTISDFQQSRQVVILSPSWNAYNSPFDEYLLLELYTPTGLNKFDSDYQYSGVYPQGPNSVGIRLWHVDARLLRSGSFTTNCGLSNVRGAFNNTSTTSENGGRTCEAGAAYQNYNLLQLIRNNKTTTTQTTNSLSAADLFRQGSSFSQSSYSSQFPNGTMLNSNVELGWTFSVSYIAEDNGVYKATINFVKA